MITFLTDPKIADRLTDRELREFFDWAILQNRSAKELETFEAWLASEWADSTVRDWLNGRTGVAQGALDDEKLFDRAAS